jgi:hypothetical protein
MTHFSARFFAVLTVSSMIAAGQARADWSYSTSAVPPGFAVNAPGNNGGGTVQLTAYKDVASSSSINVLAYQTTATAPVTFNAASSTYTLTMTLTDNTTHDSGTLTFTGSISGGLDQNNSTLVNTFANPTQTLTLDGNKYTVTLPSSVALLPPSSNQQNITATVSVSSSGPGGGVQGVPEPASLVLGGLGFSLFGVSSWWQRLRRSARQTA